jgi:malonate decarboxylase beta subunit
MKNFADVSGNSQRRLAGVAPHERIAALADPGSVQLLAPPGPSPDVARYGIAAHDDDGVVTARILVAGEPMLIAAQDERYLAGSVGTRHARALLALFDLARREHPAAVVLLMASGGVRLHEANAAELALSRVLSTLLDARLEGIGVLAIGVGHVFGGASVLACAADRLALLPQVRIGLSGPKVLESVHGKWELDADDAREVDAVFGAVARNRAGQADLLADDADAVRAWLAHVAVERRPCMTQIYAMHTRLAARIAGEPTHIPAFEALPCFDGATPVDRDARLWRRPECWLTPPNPGATLGPADVHAQDSALLLHVAAPPAAAPDAIVLVEDSAGHTVSRAAEMRFVSQFLAHHAAVLALLRAQRKRLVGLLAGVGHSAAFFANALQAPVLYALADAQVVAMAPEAIARVTGLDASRLVEDDPLLGHPVRHFAAQGGITRIISGATLAAMGL